MSEYGYVKRNFDELSYEISELSKRYSDKPVTLVSVTKSATDAEVLELCRAGASDIGENRPQMLMGREALLSGAGLYPRLHEIGTLQRNKVKLIGAKCALIHSVDSVKLAECVSREGCALGKKIPVLIEINSACEASKGGIDPMLAESFYHELCALPGISVNGIMTMGPVCENPEDIRPYFRKTKEIFDLINSRYGFTGGGILSMGMSDSYKIAIEEGSTLVRVGRRLFIK